MQSGRGNRPTPPSTRAGVADQNAAESSRKAPLGDSTERCDGALFAKANRRSAIYLSEPTMRETGSATWRGTERSVWGGRSPPHGRCRPFASSGTRRSASQ